MDGTSLVPQLRQPLTKRAHHLLPSFGRGTHLFDPNDGAIFDMPMDRRNFTITRPIRMNGRIWGANPNTFSETKLGKLVAQVLGRPRAFKERGLNLIQDVYWRNKKTQLKLPPRVGQAVMDLALNGSCLRFMLAARGGPLGQGHVAAKAPKLNLVGEAGFPGARLNGIEILMNMKLKGLTAAVQPDARRLFCE
ncbi:MAG: hypothetical protein Ct9H300mP7_5790 [Verrucomicrobiota bacterium]|nr:MAG: hypothetical protein Ct9H300mP7_5790 [Verrucomicrobiota bacterium]